MWSGDGSTGRLRWVVTLTWATASSRFMRPAKNWVWFGMLGSSLLPKMPSGPGAVGVVSEEPSELLSVFFRLYSKSLCPYETPKSVFHLFLVALKPAVPE